MHVIGLKTPFYRYARGAKVLTPQAAGKTGTVLASARANAVSTGFAIPIAQSEALHIRHYTANVYDADDSGKLVLETATIEVWTLDYDTPSRRFGLAIPFSMTLNSTFGPTVSLCDDWQEGDDLDGKGFIVFSTFSIRNTDPGAPHDWSIGREFISYETWSRTLGESRHRDIA